MDQRVERLIGKIEFAKKQIVTWEKEIESYKAMKVNVDLLNKLYWQEGAYIEKLQIQFDLARGDLLSFIRPYDTGYKCTVCQKPHIGKSRSDLIKIFRHSHPHRIKTDPQRKCQECIEKEKKEREERRWQKKHETKTQSSFQPRQSVTASPKQFIPYKEYIESVQWKARRQEHLVRVGFRCQVCNAGNTILNVHHGTYERIGDERYEDLIVLCKDCHEIFYKNGKLAE